MEKVKHKLLNALRPNGCSGILILTIYEQVNKKLNEHGVA